MTVEIVLVFVILGVAIALFVTEKLRADLVALLVLVALALSGLVRPDQALSGFSNPAVVTIWAMFILSAGLTRTGVSNLLGGWVLRFARKGEARLVAVLMSVTALLSAVMNNTGVAAMFLPITLEIARRTGRSPSRLLLPMAYGSLLGGLMLLVGTASNLVVRDAMRSAGYTPLGIFDFAPVGLLILFISVVYMALLGRRLLPARQMPQPLSAGDSANGQAAPAQYALDERLAYLLLPDSSALAGKTLVESRIGRALELNILSIERRGHSIPAEPQSVLEGGDRLLVLGRLEKIDEICGRPLFTLEDSLPPLRRLVSSTIGLAEFSVMPQAAFSGKPIGQADFRRRYHLNVLAVRQGRVIRRTNLAELVLNPGDTLLVQGPVERLEAFAGYPAYRRMEIWQVDDYRLDERLLSLSIPPASALVGKTLQAARLGAAYGLGVLAVTRQGETYHLPAPDMPLQAGDLLVVGGRPLDIEILRGLQTLEVERQASLGKNGLEDGPFQFVEVMLSPFSQLAGKTLRELHFREKFGLSVLAIWRGERAHRSGLADIPLQLGDALLCYGAQERFKTLANERDFVVLRMALQQKPRTEKAVFASLVMVGVMLAAIFGGVPISIAAIGGSALMVLGGALTMDEAYQGISWKAFFLIAAMLPMGIAMQETGAAGLLGQGVVGLLGQFGPTAILGGLMLLAMLVTQFMPAPVAAVLLSPIALTAALNQGIAPQAYMLGIAYALGASFLSPVSIPVNILVMSPGGYRYSDYLKNGLPLSLIVLAVSMVALPVFFPY